MSSTRHTPAPVALEEVRSMRALYDAHGGFVWRTLRHLGVPPRELDDATQEVFLAIHRRRDAYDGRAALRTWIFGFCRNVARNSRRATSRKTHDALEEHDAVDAGLADRLADRDLARRASAALAELPEEQRLAFVLFDVEGMSMVEVAAALSCPLQTAYTRLYAARDRLRRALTEVNHGR